LTLCWRLSSAAARAFHVTKSVDALAGFAADDLLPLGLLGITRSYQEGGDVMGSVCGIGRNKAAASMLGVLHSTPSWPVHRDRPFSIGASADQQPAELAPAADL
jgi:hypothetical protein